MENLPKNRVPVSVGIPLDLLTVVDNDVVLNKYKSRSEYIVRAIREKQARDKANK